MVNDNDKQIVEWLGNDDELASNILKKKYLIDGVESINDFLNRVSNKDERVKELIKNKKFLFGGRILSNRGLYSYGLKTTYSNCYVLSVDDSIESIYECAKNMARTYSYGGGVGIDISNLRPKGAIVHNSAKTTTGAVSFMKTFDVVTATIGQNGRRGALMISLDVNHPDIEDFIEIKANTTEITNANISIKMNDEFMNSVLNKEDYYLRWPCNVKDVPEGVKSELEYFNGLKVRYDKESKKYEDKTIEKDEEFLKLEKEIMPFLNRQCCVQRVIDGQMCYFKKVNADKLFRKLSENNWDYAEPGILFWDRIKNWHMMSENKEFSYAGVNPCLVGDTLIHTEDGFVPIKDLVGTTPVVLCVDDNMNIIKKQATKVWKTKVNAELVEVKYDATSLICTPDHKILTKRGYVEAQNLTTDDRLIGGNMNIRGIQEYSVLGVEKLDRREDVYDMTVPEVHNFLAKYIVVHNCAEEPLPDGGACLLGSMVLSSYVKNREFDYNEFKKDCKTATLALNQILDEGLKLHPLEVQRSTVGHYKQIGLGLLGLASVFVKLGIKYGTEESIELADKITHTMLIASFEESCDLNEENIKYDNLLDSPFYKERIEPFIGEEYRGRYPRNSQLLTIAPTGTLSTMINETGGGEPMFDVEYTRTTKSIGEKTYKVYPQTVIDYFGDKENINTSELPDYFITADKLGWKERIDMQSVLQKNIDASISSTINLPETATVDEVYDIYMYAWKKGLKGVTIYRDKCKRSGILNRGDNKEEKEFKFNNALKRPKTLDADFYQVKSNGESFLVLVGLMDGRPYETFAMPYDGTEVLFKKDNEVKILNNENPIKIEKHRGTITKLKKRFYTFESDLIKIDNIAIEPDENHNILDEIDNIKNIINNLIDGQNGVIKGKILTNNDTDNILKGLQNIITYYTNDSIRDVTLHVSMALRHSIKHEFVTDVEKKCNPDFLSVPSVIGRILSKYSKAKETEELCPECGSKLIRENGCIHCVTCGWSRCD